MSTYSLSDLGTRVLKDLGLVGAEETPSSNDQAWVEETAQSEVAMMSSIGLPIWNGSVMAIPEEYLTILSRRVGLAVAASYGLMSMAEAQLAMREAERYLTVLAAPRAATPLAMRTDDALRTRGATFNFTSGR